MIVVTRLNGPRFAVNPDLVQRIESTPDTILTLVDGSKYIVAESMEEVTRLVVAYRAQVVAATVELAARAEAERAAEHATGRDDDAPTARPVLRSVSGGAVSAPSPEGD